ncbi:asparaginase [Streptomyces lunaelactis]|uniref:asparaginase n=1 Tax=Streptomyces lunaelactis TaxID=1535768 RepID=UPI0026CC6091
MTQPVEETSSPERRPQKTAVIREPRHVPLAHVVRGDIVEGVHHGSVVVLSADGGVAFQAGDIEAAFYPCSALKPVQVVGMLRAGLSLDDELLALAVASHSGEERHLVGVQGILDFAGLAEADLRNAPDWPCDPAVREAWVRCGRGLSRLAQNGSGTHAAMLVTAQARGWPLDDYLDSGHPLQQSIAEAVEDLTGERIARVTVDECGAPLFSVSLEGLTRAVAQIASADPGTEEAAVSNAIRNHPEMASGSWRDVARLMRAVPGLLANDGFEGIQVAALPDGRAVGVKIADGGDRALMPVVAAALALCGVDRGVLTEFASRPVLSGMTMVGSLRAAGALTSDFSAVPPAPEEKGQPREHRPHAHRTEQIRRQRR